VVGRRGFIPGRNILECVIFVMINNWFDIFNFVKYRYLVKTQQVWLYINY
jgi:hypothetical protein